MLKCYIYLSTLSYINMTTLTSNFTFPKTLKPTLNPYTKYTFHSTSQQKPMQNNKPAQNVPRKGPRKPFSRRSVLKKSFTQEQVDFSSAPVSDDPNVAILGGGMSGLMCALHLHKRGIRSTVFDTGMHGLGGRMGTRIIDPHPLLFDHAAQFFTASDPRFVELVAKWSEKGLVRKWEGIIGDLEVGGRFAPLPSSPSKYIGVNGMRPLSDSMLSEAVKVGEIFNLLLEVTLQEQRKISIAQGIIYAMALASLVNVVRPCWISKLDPFNGMWHLSENKKPCGQFDAIVIAHNGKCANRLLATSGLPLVARQMKKLDLSSIWALLAAFDDPLPIADVNSSPFEGAFVNGVDSISWMANNSKKLLPPSDTGPHCWTFFSTAAFAKRNKVPQENIPVVTSEKVKEAMLEGVEKALGLPKSSLPRPFYTRLQLWGAALPTNTLGVPCIFYPRGRAGICGDWLLGSNLEAAALSGIALANHMADYFQSSGVHPDEFAVGLENEFRPLIGHDIGQFPGLDSSEQTVGTESFQIST